MSKTEEKGYFWEIDASAELWRNEADTIKECIAEAKREYPDKEHVYIAELEDHLPRVDVDKIIDDLRETAMDECGECSDGWLDTTPDLKQLEEDLQSALENWMNNNNLNPNFGKVVSVKKYDL